MPAVTPPPLEFRTRSLYLAAYLRVVGVPLARVERGSQLASFVFSDAEGRCVQLERDYAADRVVGPIAAYARAVVEVKKLANGGL